MNTSRIMPVMSFILLVTVCVLSSCGDGSKPPTPPSDNNRKVPDTTPQKFTGFGLVPFKANKDKPYTQIPARDADLATQFNQEFHLLRAEGQYVNGFMFDPADFKKLTGLKPASIFFQIGVSNFADSINLRARRVEPSYTIMVIPLNADSTRMKDAAGEYYAFDFTCPCPANAKCCPKE